MRHLGGIAIGFFGTFIGVVVIAAALGLTRRAVEQLTRGPLLLGIGVVADRWRRDRGGGDLPTDVGGRAVDGCGVDVGADRGGSARAVLALPTRDRPGVQRRPGHHDEPAGARAADGRAGADVAGRRRAAGRATDRGSPAAPPGPPAPSRPTPSSRGGCRSGSGPGHDDGARPVRSRPVVSVCSAGSATVRSRLRRLGRTPVTRAPHHFPPRFLPAVLTRVLRPA